MFNIHVDYGELSTFVANLRGMKLRLEDYTKPLQAIKKYQIRRWAKNFTSEGGIYGAWAPLAAYTNDERESEGYPREHPILRRSGKLLGWVDTHNKLGKVSADAVYWEFHASGAKDGSYAVFHDGGFFSTKFGVPVPSRVIWDVNSDDEDGNEKRVANYVEQVLQDYFT